MSSKLRGQPRGPACTFQTDDLSPLPEISQVWGGGACPPVGGSLCPQPGCGVGILPHPDTPTTCSWLTFRKCGYVLCRDCGHGVHLGPCLPCGEDDDGGGGPGPGADSSSVSSMSAMAMARRCRWTVADPSNVTIRVISKPCPDCRLVQ